MNPLPLRDASKVVAYVRTSSAEQGKAFGPDVQRRDIEAYASRESLTIVAEHHEDISGTTPAEGRAGLQAAIVSAYRHGAFGILVSEHSRLARKESVAYGVIEAIEGAGLRVLYANTSNTADDSGLLMDGMAHVIAAHERRRIVARLKAGREAKAAQHPDSRAQGGKSPHGYKRDGAGLVTVDPVTAAEVRRIYDLVRGGLSIRKAAAALSAETGRTWTPNTVDRIVRREDYKRAGDLRIVDPRIWNQAAAALASRRRSPGRVQG